MSIDSVVLLLASAPPLSAVSILPQFVELGAFVFQP